MGVDTLPNFMALIMHLGDKIRNLHNKVKECWENTAQYPRDFTFLEFSREKTIPW